MVTRKIEELKEWDKNPRSITKDAFARLKEQLKLGQHSTLLVTKDGTILGGNMRIKAMREVGLKEVKCIEVEFVKKPEGVMAIVDGEPITTRYYKTENDGMMEYSLSHNDRAGFYDMDTFQNIKDNFSIDWSKYAVDFEVPKDIASIEQMLLANGLGDDYSKKLGEVVYEPKKTNHSPKDLFQAEHKFDAEIEAINSKELREMLYARVAYFSTFNFSKIADYYAYQATPEEQKIIEKLALVLLDRDKLIENGFSKVQQSIVDENDSYDKDTDK